MSDFPSQKLDKFVLRLPDGLRDRIKNEAARHGRSMNAEIVTTLEEKYPAPILDSDLDRVQRLIGGMLTYIPTGNLPQVSGQIDRWLSDNGYPLTITIKEESGNSGRSFTLRRIQKRE